MNTSPLLYYSRPRRLSDWKCQRSRYWNYEYRHVGVVKESTGIELFLGVAIHDGLAAIATHQRDRQKVDIDLIASTLQQQVAQTLLEQAVEGQAEAEATLYAKEQGSLVEGLLRGFYRHMWPRLMEQYPTILAIEQPMVFRHDHLGQPDPTGLFGFMAKPDLVLGDIEGNCFYIEFKSTSSKKESWIDSWNTAVQVHATVRAIEAHLKREVTGVIIQGLYKGFESYGKQSSPVCYAYLKAGNPPFTDTVISYEYKPGLKRFPTWELPGGVATWVAGMPEAILADQFPQTPPIYPKDDLINNFFLQSAIREAEIAAVTTQIEQPDTSPEQRLQLLNRHFPQAFEQCSPAWGYGCSYRGICHGGGNDPLEHGFILRNTEHEEEYKEL